MYTKTMIKKIGFFLATVLIISGVWYVPAVLAQAGAAPCGTAGAAACSDAFKLNIKFTNPLKVNTIQDAIKLFVNGIVRIAIPIIVIFFLWSGLSFVLALGNPEKIKKAKDMFFYTVIGTLLILGAWTITNAIIGTVNSITN